MDFVNSEMLFVSHTTNKELVLVVKVVLFLTQVIDAIKIFCIVLILVQIV